MDRHWARCYTYAAGIGLLLVVGCVPGGGKLKSTTAVQEKPNVAPSAQSPTPDKTLADPGSKSGHQESPPQPAIVPEPRGYRIVGDEPLLQERLTLFEKKKGEWYAIGSQLAELKTGAAAWPDSWQECLQEIELALNGYRGLHTGKEQNLNPLTVLGRDLHYFDKGCDQVLAAAKGKLSPPQEQPSPSPATPVTSQPSASPDSPVRHMFETGQFQEVVTTIEAPAQEQGSPPSLSRETKEYYCRALVRLGRFQDAARSLTDLLKEYGQTTDLTVIEMKILTADVLLAIGKTSEAREVYAAVAKNLTTAVTMHSWVTAHAHAFSEQVNDDDLLLYQELIQVYLRFDGQQISPQLADSVRQLQSRKPGPLLDLARLIQTTMTAKSQDWAKAQLGEVRSLIERRDLEGARALVDRLAAGAPPEMREAIAALQGEISQAEAAGQQAPPPSEGTATADPWAESMRLFEQQKYDEAIAGFQKLVNGERGAEAKAKIAEAADLAAAALRRQAAALYAKARKLFDPEAKRQALQSSRALIRELIEKYPGSTIADKARQNLKILDSEINQLGPGAPTRPPPAAGNGPTL